MNAFVLMLNSEKGAYITAWYRCCTTRRTQNKASPRNSTSCPRSEKAMAKTQALETDTVILWSLAKADELVVRHAQASSRRADDRMSTPQRRETAQSFFLLRNMLSASSLGSGGIPYFSHVRWHSSRMCSENPLVGLNEQQAQLPNDINRNVDSTSLA
jgi:hypothetical protein